jgi:hypothetical protein
MAPERYDGNGLSCRYRERKLQTGFRLRPYEEERLLTTATHHRVPVIRRWACAAFIAGAGLGSPVSATPVPLPPDLLPIEIPANGAFGIGIRVNAEWSDGFLFRYLTENGGLFSMHSVFGDRHDYLTCVNPDQGPQQ